MQMKSVMPISKNPEQAEAIRLFRVITAIYAKLSVFPKLRGVSPSPDLPIDPSHHMRCLDLPGPRKIPPGLLALTQPQLPQAHEITAVGAVPRGIVLVKNQELRKGHGKVWYAHLLRSEERRVGKEC